MAQRLADVDDAEAAIVSRQRIQRLHSVAQRMRQGSSWFSQRTFQSRPFVAMLQLTSLNLPVACQLL